MLQLATVPISETAVKADSGTREGLRVECSFTSPLARSRSVEFLPYHRNISTSTLRELFESKVAMETKSGYQTRSHAHMPRPVSMHATANDEGMEDTETSNKSTLQPMVRTEAVGINVNPVTPKVEKVMRTPWSERKKTTHVDDKRQSETDIRDSASLYGWEKSPISVKAISALYLSKVAPVDHLGSLLKPEQNPYSTTRPKVIKFQPAAQDMCCVCLRPVYYMEKMVAGKLIFHKNCFCCKHCKKKLSVRDYAPLYGEFYCVLHYKQLFRKKGNYDEAFGHQQHKNRWLVQNQNASDSK
ncbi:LIM domain and actin-binding protein 1 [Electrophorus electricus]|uniref:LIM domain and actin-binding protein 1 n=1 Tax=Electrophorus electricus TaxID=8005 RepID=UPI0015CFB7F1|nr:LIM domain and actin-binding protein 1 [Electrophorus electricus]